MRGYLFAALAALMLAGGARAAEPYRPAPEPAARPGRYIVVHSPHVERDTILLDTETGRTWVLTSFTDYQNGPSGWVPMPRLDNDAEMLAFRRSQTPCPSSAPNCGSQR